MNVSHFIIFCRFDVGPMLMKLWYYLLASSMLLSKRRITLLLLLMGFNLCLFLLASTMWLFKKSFTLPCADLVEHAALPADQCHEEDHHLAPGADEVEHAVGCCRWSPLYC